MDRKNTIGMSIVNIIFKLLGIILVFTTGMFLSTLFKFDMLPTFHFILITIVLTIIIALFLYLLLKNKTQTWLKTIIGVISIILISVYIYGINYINATINFMDAMTTEIIETEDYYIVTLAEDGYTSKENLKQKDIHTFMADEDYTDIKEELSHLELKFKDNESITQLAAFLYNNKTDAILLSNSQYEMLCDEYTDFKTKTKIIHTITHKIKKTEEVVDNENMENNEKQYTIDSGAFNVYISGIDTTGRISNVARSDANIVVTVNTNTNTVLLTSIPRDYYIKLYSKGVKDKLTHSGVYGIKETYKSVSEFLGIDIQYYVRVNFTTLEKIVDALGGIEVYSDYAFNALGYSFKKGKNKLNGAKALAFSRERDAFSSGDRQRIKNQQAVIQGIINKVLTSETILTKYTSLLKSLSSSFQTNISTEEISEIVKGQITNMNSWSIETSSLDGSGAYMPTYSYGSNKLYVMIPNEKSVLNAIEKINKVLEGKM